MRKSYKRHTFLTNFCAVLSSSGLAPSFLSHRTFCVSKELFTPDHRTHFFEGPLCDVSNFILTTAGPLLGPVRRVQLNPSNWVNGCMYPSILRLDTTFRLFCLIFTAKARILHPSIEISNCDTTFLSDFSY